MNHRNQAKFVSCGLPRILVLVIMSGCLHAWLLGQEAGEDPPGGGFSTAFIHDGIFLQHDTGPGFPENPDRLRRLHEHLRKQEVSRRLLWAAPSDRIDAMPWILDLTSSLAGEAEQQAFTRLLILLREAHDRHPRLLRQRSLDGSWFMILLRS